MRVLMSPIEGVNVEHDIQIHRDALGAWYWHCHTCEVGGELQYTKEDAESDSRNHINDAL